MWLLLWPARAAAAAWDFSLFWLFTRPWKMLLYGLPALLVGLYVVGVVVYEWSGLDRGSLAMYRWMVNESIDKRDRPAAEIFLRKLRALDEMGPDTRYAEARLAELRGDDARVARLMRELAPPDKAGQPGAHFWMAQRMLRENRRLTDEETAELVHHLEQALGSDRDRQAAHILLANIERREASRDEAARHLEAVVLDRPEMRLALSAVYTELGDSFRAATAATRRGALPSAGRTGCQRRRGAAMFWSRAVVLSGDFEEAEKILAAACPAEQADETPETRAAPAAAASARRSLCRLVGQRWTGGRQGFKTAHRAAAPSLGSGS